MLGLLADLPDACPSQVGEARGARYTFEMPSESFVAHDVAIVRRNGLVLAAACAPLALGALLLLGSMAIGSAALTAFGAILTWCGFFTGLFTYVQRPLDHARRVELQADDTGLYFDGTRVAERSAITTAYLQPYDEELPTVKVMIDATSQDTSSASLEVRVRDAEQGQELLRALGQDVSRSAVSFGRVQLGESGSALSLAMLFVGIVASLGGAAFALQTFGVGMMTLPTVFAAAVAFVYFGGRSADVSVGADGVQFAQRRGSFFLPYAEIVSIDQEQCDAVIDVGKDEPFVVRFSQRHHAAAAIPELTAFIERVREGLSAYRASSSEHLAAAMLARGERSGGEWLRAIRALDCDGGDAYRTPRIPHDRLWRLVEDPSAPTTARAGAALLLRNAIDDDGRARLRIAADASASPGLRVALTAAASEQCEAELAHALDACEDAEGPARLRLARTPNES